MGSSRSFLRAGLGLLAVLGFAGCTLVVGSLVQDPVQDCTDRADGTPCEAAEICLDGECTYSACGDGYIDDARGEECDDANAVSGDGCEPGRCRFTCTRDAQCEDESPCTGSAGCDLDDHRCRQPVPLSGAACLRADQTPGTCRVGSCAAAGCGNGVVGAGEECDDTTEGCAADCQFICDAESPCSTVDVCTQPVACDAATHACEPEPSLECDDGDPCTAESCSPTDGCASVAVDADLDGYSPATCSPGSLALGGDCDDLDPAQHPNAPEMLNQADDDCDGTVDENPGVLCLEDADGDGWGDASKTMFLPACGSGWVAERASSDCHDGNSAVNPGVTTASATPYCVTGSLSGSIGNGFSCSTGVAPSWDWNCSGSATPSIASVIATCSGLAACGGVYWANAVPACGTRGTLRGCMQSCLLNLCSCKDKDTADVAQSCL